MEAVKETTPTMIQFDVDLKQALLWVARALDYVESDDIFHNHRVAYIAYQTAKALGWSQRKVEFSYFAGMVHDCGVSETKEHLRLLAQLVPEDAQAHCMRGYQALKKCRVLAPFATPILYHHTPWQTLATMDVPEFEKDVAALLYLADRVDHLRTRFAGNCHVDLVTHQAEIIAENVMMHSGTLFHPKQCEAMQSLVMTEGFWFAMESSNIESIGMSFVSADWAPQGLTLEEMNTLGTFLAHIVDAKSAFTYQHSQKVAEIARFLAEKLGLNDSVQEMTYIAALVHDIGKLKTADEILHKPSALTDEEYTRIKRHTIDTEIALYRIFPNSKIAEWAANHHERLDGSGYPYHKRADQLDMPSRIIAVADVFQALSQERPYRAEMKKDEIAVLMDEMVADGRLCSNVYRVLTDHFDHCYQLSIHRRLSL